MLVTDKYNDQEIIYITDQDSLSRIIVITNQNNKCDLYAYNIETANYYPVIDITIGGIEGKRYFIMSTDSLQNVPQRISQNDNNKYVYAICSNGEGNYYRITSDGELLDWNEAVKKDREKVFNTILFICLALSVFAFGVFIFFSIIKGKKSQEGLLNRKQYIFAIRELTSREIKRKYARSYLGVIWSVLNPLLHMIVMTIIFSYMFKKSIENFPMYFLTGHLFYDFFTNATNHAMSALVDNKGLLLKAKLPKQTFVISRVYTSLVNFGFSCIAYVLMFIVLGVKPTWRLIFFPLDLILAIMLATGVAYLLSILYVFFADIKYLYGVFITMLMYMSALFYPVGRLPGILQKIIEFNPVYLTIYIARESMVYGRTPHYSAWIKLIIFSIVSFSVGYFVFMKKQNDVMQKV